MKRIKAWIRKKFNQLKFFYWNHEEEIKVGAPVVIGLLGGCLRFTKKIHRKIDANRNQRMKDTRYYDRSQNMYVKLKRKRTQSDWNEIHRRQKNGEKMGDILKDMDLIK